MSSQLIARDAEFARVLDAVHDGAGAVISGDAGVGKTALARAVVQRVAAAGDNVVWLVGTTASREIPFGTVAPMLPDGVAAMHPSHVLREIGRQLRQDAGRRSSLVVIDDAHLLDDRSAAVVLGLMTSGATRIVATIRSGERAPDAVHTLWKDGFVASVSLDPFDLVATKTFLTDLLGGDVAVATAALLWRQTRGNALYLNEIARDALTRGQLVDEGGVWMWRGLATVPPLLADLLDRRFEGLSWSGLDALGLLVLAQPLSLDALTSIAGSDAVAELERRGVVEAERRNGSAMYRFAHPLTTAAAERLLPASRRSRLADILARGPHAPDDTVRRATLQLEGTGEPDVGVLLAGATAVLLTRPELAEQFANRALSFDDSPAAALMLADARAEQGEIEAAREAQRVAITRIRTPEDRMAVRVNEVSLITFSDRRPDRALAAIEAARRELPERFHVELDSVTALISLFATRPVAALAEAERVLAVSPSRTSVIRALSTKVIALHLLDQPKQSHQTAEQLATCLATGPVGPYQQGIADLASEIARHLKLNADDSLLTDPASGRWFIPRSDVDVTRPDVVAHPLFAGDGLALRGYYDLAIPLLREAFAQQRVGEGLMLSEASNALATSLAATGQTAEAERVLAEAPPDRLALHPGLGPSAAAAIAASAGHPAAIDLSFQAASEARAAGVVIAEVGFLADAGRYGAAVRAAERLDELGQDFNTPLTAARAAGLRARANGDGKALLDAAERFLELGLVRHTKEFAELAAAALGRGRSTVRSRAHLIVREMAIRLHESIPAAAPVVPLTRRELEVAHLAAKGMADRDIATVLHVSVRTVESHVASAYRKLDIRSRNGLRGALNAFGISA